MSDSLFYVALEAVAVAWNVTLQKNTFCHHADASWLFCCICVLASHLFLLCCVFRLQALANANSQLCSISHRHSPPMPTFCSLSKAAAQGQVQFCAVSKPPVQTRCEFAGGRTKLSAPQNQGTSRHPLRRRRHALRHHLSHSI
jgi:hypothetical protein